MLYIAKNLYYARVSYNEALSSHSQVRCGSRPTGQQDSPPGLVTFGSVGWFCVITGGMGREKDGQNPDRRMHTEDIW